MKRYTIKMLAVSALMSVLLGVCSCGMILNGPAPMNGRNDPKQTNAVAKGTTEETTRATTRATTVETSSENTEPTAKVKNLSPEWVRELPQAQDLGTTQLIVVSAAGMNKSTAKVSMHERDVNGNWIQLFSVNAYIGKNGLIADDDRTEGCGKTPIGVYQFNKAFGIASDPGCAISYTKVTGDMYWSGDSSDGMPYNELVSVNEYPDLDIKSSEHLIEHTKAYQYCLSLTFNEEGTPGRGYAIFFHCYGDYKYTEGCVALPKDTMVKIMKRVDPSCIIVIDTAKNLNAQ